jgi:DeoR/GlpR family transcriptional regulator of sugar metabolism
MVETEMSQETVLMMIQTFGPISALELQNAFGCSRASIRSALKYLEKHGEIRYIKGVRIGKGGRCGLWDVV